MKQWLINFFDDVILFLKNIPLTLKESLIWFLMSYCFPIIQIVIIVGIREGAFEWSLDILNIILVTNASLFTAILLIVNSSTKDKRVINILTIFAYVVTIVLFAISTVEINKRIVIFSKDWYFYGSCVTLFLALIFGLISKYDEVKAKRKSLADKGKQKKSTNINGEEFEL